MKNFCNGQVTGILVGSSKTFAEEELQTTSVSQSQKVNSTQKTNPRGFSNSKDSGSNWTKKIGKKADSLAQGLLDHVNLGQNISETIKEKLNLSKKIFRSDRFERVFTKSFDIDEEEKLLKTYQCYLSTTAGQIAGLLFISNKKIAFRSEKSISVTSPKGELVKVPYKVSIPLGKIKSVSPSVNVNNPEQRYLQIVTIDEFEFWLMGFVNYQRSLIYLEKIILELQ